MFCFSNLKKNNFRQWRQHTYSTVFRQNKSRSDVLALVRVYRTRRLIESVPGDAFFEG